MNMANDVNKQEKDSNSDSEETRGTITEAGENDYTFDGYKIILNKKIILVPKAKSTK